MGLTPVFNPDTGASGGPTPATPPAAADGAPKLVIDTDFKATPTVDMSSVGTFTVDGIAWTSTSSVATTAEANATGFTITSSAGSGSGFSAQIPDVAAGDFVCMVFVFEPTTMGHNDQEIIIKLGQAAAADSNTIYDLEMRFKRVSGKYRCRHGYRAASSWTEAYIGDNPWGGGSLPSRITMMLYGSGYSWQTRMSSTATEMPDFRGVVGTENASGSLRSRGAGQLQNDTNPTNLQYAKVVFGPSGDPFTVKMVGLRVWVGARVV